LGTDGCGGCEAHAQEDPQVEHPAVGHTRDGGHAARVRACGARVWPGYLLPSHLHLRGGVHARRHCSAHNRLCSAHNPGCSTSAVSTAASSADHGLSSRCLERLFLLLIHTIRGSTLHVECELQMLAVVRPYESGIGSHARGGVWWDEGTRAVREVCGGRCMYVMQTPDSSPFLRKAVEHLWPTKAAASAGRAHPEWHDRPQAAGRR
jgi:hypothetical protein